MQTVGITPRSLQCLLTHSLDYAGLFPPASLDLEQSVRNYAAYLEQPAAWMLGRFISPVSRVDELLSLLRETLPPTPWQLSVLGTGGDDADGFLQALECDLRTLEAVAHAGSELVNVASMEVRWPVKALDLPFTEVTSLLSRITGKFEEASIVISEIYFEIPAHNRFRGSIENILLATSQLNDMRSSGVRPLIGAKIRCGGTEPSAFPSVPDVAGFLSACTREGVPFKATAGLHHPLYHLDTELGVQMHGFLNVFAAAVLLNERVLNEEETRTLLADDDLSHFDFQPDHLAWNGHAISAYDIGRARSTSILSFGSCSFEEPQEDLQHLGLM